MPLGDAIASGLAFHSTRKTPAQMKTVAPPAGFSVNRILPPLLRLTCWTGLAQKYPRACAARYVRVRAIRLSDRDCPSDHPRRPPPSVFRPRPLRESPSGMCEGARPPAPVGGAIGGRAALLRRALVSLGSRGSEVSIRFAVNP